MASGPKPHIAKSLIAKPRIALALGGGGARGLAHIVVLEALVEAGIEPVAIAGTSIGAIIGAAYAAGLAPAALRKHALRSFRDRAEVMAKLFTARTGRLASIFAGGRLGNPVLMDGERLLAGFWPSGMPETFEDLKLPFTAVATDYYGRGRVALDKGPLRAAVAASMAIPGMLQPVVLDGRVLIDGGAVDPVPFDCLPPNVDLVMAVDVTGGPSPGPDQRPPSPMEAALGASQIMQAAILEVRLQRGSAAGNGPRLHLLRPAVERFNALDFFSAKAILSAADGLKADIAAVLREAAKPLS